ncbi:TetR/AcrR family transcriptional regulator [Gordonia sp. VNK21]|uniref:TetR/AcrR family transcriptional regulator n=1 Tax=Gordonia sp. VNK21 TaxID=3382483 RepID=UPI0038D50C45
MTEEAKSDTRTRLLDAAADLIAAAPGEDFSLREVCDQAGVKMPTLYHFFGNKQGLVDAVVERGFELYVQAKQAQPSSGDPIQDLRDGWDAHVAFGLANPGFYTLMYGKVRPGDARPAQAKPAVLLRELVQRADDQGRLAVPPDQAAAHILATNIGITLRQIIFGRADPELSAAAREAVLAAVTGAAAVDDDGARSAVLGVLDYAAGRPEVLGAEETALLTHWLRRLADSAGP